MVRNVSYLLLLSLFLVGCEPNYSPPVPPSSTQLSKADQKELEAIDQEMAEIQKKIQTLDKESYNEMMDAQREMLSNWDQFSVNIEESEKINSEANALERRLFELRVRRDQILQNK